MAFSKYNKTTHPQFVRYTSVITIVQATMPAIYMRRLTYASHFSIFIVWMLCGMPLLSNVVTEHF